MGVSILVAVIRLFEILKMFYPRERLCGAEPERCPIVFTYALSPRGNLRSRARKGSNMLYGIGNVSISKAVLRLFEILKMFYPPEGFCVAEPERGPIVFTYALLV